MLPFSVCFSQEYQHFTQKCFGSTCKCFPRAKTVRAKTFRVGCDPSHLQSFETLSRVWQETEEREWVYRALSANLGHRGGRRELTRDCWNMPEIWSDSGSEGAILEGVGGCYARLEKLRESWSGSGQPVQQLWEILTKKVQIKWKENFSFIIARDKSAAGVRWGQQTSSYGVLLTLDSIG